MTSFISDQLVMSLFHTVNHLLFLFIKEIFCINPLWFPFQHALFFILNRLNRLSFSLKKVNNLISIRTFNKLLNHYGRQKGNRQRRENLQLKLINKISQILHQALLRQIAFIRKNIKLCCNWMIKPNVHRRYNRKLSYDLIDVLYLYAKCRFPCNHCRAFLFLSWRRWKQTKEYYFK